MATLTSNQIDLTYQGLIKTDDNAALGVTEKVITDGVGTASTLKLGTGSASFTGDLNLTDATVIGLPSGGGTPPMELLSLPPMKTALGGAEPWNTWCANTGYGTDLCSALDTTNADLSVFPQREGQITKKIKFRVATSQPAATCNIAIYAITTDANGNMVAGNKLKDCPAVDASSVGNKIIDMSADPFVMPAGSTYGAVIIAVTSTVSGVSLTAWGNPVWSGNSGVDFGDDTTYRAIGWRLTSGLTGGVFPASLATAIYGGETSRPLWIFTT